MTARDDYPSLLEPWNGPTVDDCDDALDEIDRLRRWKEEALPRLAVLHEMHDTLPIGRQAQLGESMDQAVLEFVQEQASSFD